MRVGFLRRFSQSLLGSLEVFRRFRFVFPGLSAQETGRQPLGVLLDGTPRALAVEVGGMDARAARSKTPQGGFLYLVFDGFFLVFRVFYGSFWCFYGFSVFFMVFSGFLWDL